MPAFCQKNGVFLSLQTTSMSIYLVLQRKLLIYTNMKKYCFWLCWAVVFALLSCSREEEEEPPFSFPVEEERTAVIDRLYAISMRREIPFPFSAYVLRLNNGSDVYMLRYRYNADLSVGETIRYRVFSFCPDEISVLNGVELGDGSDVDNAAAETGHDPQTRGLIASDPVEATVADVFDMKIRYSLTFLPIDTWFIALTDGNLIYAKKSKLKLELKPGDRIVYNVYTLSPNEVLAIKKLN